MLELAILGLLKEQDLHGYELKKRLTESVGALSSVSFGSLYPALARLERAGAVTVVSTAFRARLSEPVLRPGRARKVYGITPQGEELFDELLLTGAADDDRSFGLKLAFARHLDPAARLGLLERRRAQLVERLAQARGAFRAGRDRLDRYARSLVEHRAEITEHDISWLDRLIADELRTQADAAGADRGRTT